VTRPTFLREDGPPILDGGRIEGAEPLDAAVDAASARRSRLLRPRRYERNAEDGEHGGETNAPK